MPRPLPTPLISGVVLLAFGLSWGNAAEPVAPLDVKTLRIAKTAEDRDWTAILVHHSATTGGSVESIHANHRARRDAAGNPWRGIGYHFVIGNGNGMADGEVEATFRWRGQLSGAHAGNRAHNDHSVGVCLIGNFQNAPPSPAQLVALRSLIAALRGQHGLADAPILPHSAVRKTACPGRMFPAQLLTSEATASRAAIATARKESL